MVLVQTFSTKNNQFKPIKQIFQGLHPRLVTEGFELAKKKALEVRSSWCNLKEPVRESW